MLKHQLIHPKINEVIGRAGHHAQDPDRRRQLPGLVEEGAERRGRLPEPDAGRRHLRPGARRPCSRPCPIEAVNTMMYETDGPYALDEDPPVWDEYRGVIRERGPDAEAGADREVGLLQGRRDARPRPDHPDRRPAAVRQRAALGRRADGLTRHEPHHRRPPALLAAAPAVRLPLARRPGARPDPPRLPARATWSRCSAPPASTGRVFVQTQHDLDENRWALGLAERHPFIAGVVGWVDLASPRLRASSCSSSGDHPKFVGVRHVTQDEPDDDFIVRADVLRGLAGAGEARRPVRPALLRQAPAARARPWRRQLARPADGDRPPGQAARSRSSALDDWLPHFRAAAAFPNVYCKLSGMVTEADWQRLDRRRPEALRPGGARAVRPGPLHVRLRLAGLRAGRRPTSRSTTPWSRRSARSARRSARRSSAARRARFYRLPESQ